MVLVTVDDVRNIAVLAYLKDTFSEIFVVGRRAVHAEESAVRYLPYLYDDGVFVVGYLKSIGKIFE